MNSDLLMTRYLMREGEVGRVSTDSPVAIRLVPNSQNVATVTSVTIAATTIVTVTVAADTTISTKTYTFTDYANMGEMVDAINADHFFNVRILDCLRQDTIVGLKAEVITVNANYGFYDVSLVTDTSKSFSYRLCPSRRVAKQPLAIAADISNTVHRVNLCEVKYSIDLGAAGAGNFQIWRCKYNDKTRTYTEISEYAIASIDNTATTINFAAGNCPLTFRDGEEMLVRIVDGTSITDSASNYMEVSGIIE